jgi:hypothetical protein
MALTAPRSNNKDYDPVPSGVHVARLFRIVHVGTVPDSYQGEPRQTDQVLLTFELCAERRVFKEGEEAKPMSISTRFLTFSMGKKANLRKLVEGMAGISMTDDEAYSFDHETLLGDACLLTVVHVERDGKTYANIQSASPLIKGMEAPPIYTAPKLMDVNTAAQEEIETLPDFIKEKIKSSEEYDKRFRQGRSMAQPLEVQDAITPDDIPF